MKTLLARIALLTLLMTGLAIKKGYAAPPNDANGAAPRPFYIVAHNPNKLSDVTQALALGANALEPDITYASDGQYRCYDTSDPWRNANSTDTLFTDWLWHVHELVRPGGAYAGQVALITFDMKDIPSLPAGFGNFVLTSVRSILNTNGVDIPVIFSVGANSNVTTSAVFDPVFNSLGPREGLQCDAVNDVGAGLNLFRSRGYTANATWATGGTDFEADGRGWTYIDHAAYRRASEGRPKCIPYMYIYSATGNMSEMINSGTDGIICDDAGLIILWISAWEANYPGEPVDYVPFSYSHQSIVNLLNVVNGRSDIRLATPADNPFQPKNEAYALHIVTADEPDLVTTTGTNADLTFTLVGANGESSITVDASRTGRMEDEYHNYVTIPSRDLGPLTKIKIRNDGSGTGPDWKVASIQVTSARWLGPTQTPIFYNVAINAYVEGDNQFHEFTLTQQNSTPYSNAWADARIPALNTTSDPNGESAKPWQDFFTGYNLLRTGGTLHLGAGTYREMNRIDKPCRIEKETAAPYPSGNARLVYPSNP